MTRRITGRAAVSAGTTSPSDRRACGARRRRALPAPLARSDARALPPPAEPEAAGDVELQIVRTLPCGDVPRRRKGDYSILESYVCSAAFGRASRLPGEPVPLVAGDRRHPRGQAGGPAERRLSGRRSPPGPGERRCRHLARRRSAARSRRTRATIGSSPARSTRARKSCATSSTSTPRSGSSTTAG